VRADRRGVGRQENMNASRGIVGAGNGECASGGKEVQEGEFACVQSGRFLSL
jgi:hypothetical protein